MSEREKESLYPVAEKYRRFVARAREKRVDENLGENVACVAARPARSLAMA